MTRQDNNNLFENVMELLIANGFDGFADALRILLNEAMRIERSLSLGAGHYQRTPNRQGYANGYKPKTVDTRAGKIELSVPQVRGDVEFYPSALERGLRSERALTQAMAEMYVNGVSTRKVTKVLEKLCGLSVTSTQVSRATALLDEELAAWRNRPLPACRYLVLDARYEKVRVGGALISCALLIAVGVDAAGKRLVLGTSVSLSEAEVHWREFLESLQRRGLTGLRMVTSDDHKGLKAALTATMPAVPWQRCQCHLQRHAQADVPKVAMKKTVASKIRSIFDSENRADADVRLKALVEEFRKSAPQLADWAEANLPEGLTVFILPEGHRKRMRTSNMIERLNREVARRTKVATIFPNPASLLRLASAVLSEISDEWESGKIYLDMNETKE